MKYIIILFLILISSEAYSAEKYEKATFAGGCFWCMEQPFEELDGVKSVVSGYTGGQTINPSYGQVSSGSTGHLEAVEITFDPKRVSYEDLLEVLWRNINPTDSKGQFVDRGEQYTTAIYYHNEEQKNAAEMAIKKLDKSRKFIMPIVTPVKKAQKFYRAEEYHQDYYKKNPIRYKYYSYRSGRGQFVKKIWGDDQKYVPKSNEGEKAKEKKKDYKDKIKSLNKLQYHITQEDGTEPPFNNLYWNNKKQGIYVDIVSGEPLFSSTHKYKSGTGWPSFTQPLEQENIIEKADNGFFMKRVEVRSKNADSHLGHVFNDGPKPTGLRYCINSAALRFIPVEKLVSQGYGKYSSLFGSN